MKKYYTSIFFKFILFFSSILGFVNYMVISSIHNRTPKSSILYRDLSIGDFFNGHDFMKHWVGVMYCYIGSFIQNKNKLIRRGCRGPPRRANEKLLLHAYMELHKTHKILNRRRPRMKSNFLIFMSWMHSWKSRS